MSEQMYSAEDAAQILGLQVRTVRNYVREGRLPGVRIGKQYRIARADLEAFTSGTLAREDQMALALPQPEEPGYGVIEVSSIVQVDRIGRDECDRLERTLAAATMVGDGGRGLRVEPLYDEERERLKVIIVGALGETVELLRIIQAFTRP